MMSQQQVNNKELKLSGFEALFSLISLRIVKISWSKNWASREDIEEEERVKPGRVSREITKLELPLLNKEEKCLQKFSIITLESENVP